MTLIEIPGFTLESMARLEAEERRAAALLDKAMDLVKPWPSRRPGDQEKARRQLQSLAGEYRWELDARNAGKVAGVAEELERLRDFARALHEALSVLSPGAKQVLNMRHGKADDEAFRRAGGSLLPPNEPGEVSTYMDEDGDLVAEVTGHGAWMERTEALASWAKDKASKMRTKARTLGRRTLDDVIRRGTSQDWLLKACSAWMNAHEWDAENQGKLARLARLVHEAATGEKPAPGQFREAAKRGPKLNRRNELVKGS